MVRARVPRVTVPPIAVLRVVRSSAHALLLAIGSVPVLAAARAPDPGARYVQTVDAALGFARERATAALSWNHLYAPWPRRLALGLGARFTSFAGRDRLTFRTGDPDLIRDDMVNALVIEEPFVNSLNLQLLAVARLAGPMEVGFDVDLVGFSFGARRTGDYGSADPALASRQRARVSSFDLLLIDIRDRGQLNSELFVGWRLDDAWTVRAGLSHVATEYRTIDPLDHGNRRFRRFTTQLFAGVSRRLR